MAAFKVPVVSAGIICSQAVYRAAKGIEF
jgi:hypothetical protein